MLKVTDSPPDAVLQPTTPSIYAPPRSTGFDYIASGEVNFYMYNMAYFLYFVSPLPWRYNVCKLV